MTSVTLREADFAMAVIKSSSSGRAVIGWALVFAAIFTSPYLSRAYGDTPIAPPPVRTFSSSDGVFVCFLENREDATRGFITKARLKQNTYGGEKELYAVDLIYFPSHALVSPTGRVVLIKEKGMPNDDRALVVLDGSGNMVRKVSLAELAIESEVKRMSTTVNGVSWAHRAFFRFQSDELQIQWDWGQRTVVSLDVPPTQDNKSK